MNNTITFAIPETTAVPSKGVKALLDIAMWAEKHFFLQAALLRAEFARLT